MRARRLVISGVLACAMVLGFGCGLEKAYPAKNTFVVRAGEGHVASLTRPEVLRVESVRIAPPFDDTNLVYRDGDVAFHQDYYNVFLAQPEDLVTGELVRMLSQSKAFSEVVGPASLATVGLRLECTLTDFYADERDPRKGVAICTARYRLLREQRGETTIVGDWTLERTAPVSDDSGAAVASALGVAFGETVNQFVTVVSTQGQNTGSGQ